MKTSIGLFFTGLLFLGSDAVAQAPAAPGVALAKAAFQAKQVISPAPEAAELGKYGNVPISLFTGTPSVSVPLFELKGNKVSLPISLSYNASGFKPEEQATWVGSGWSLNAGGVITRAVTGNPDNTNNYFGQNNLNPPDRLDLIPYFSFIKDINEGLKETQPDVYYYNFAGQSGKFFLKPDYSVIKKEDDLKIITPCMTGCFNSNFTIVDEQGTTYLFEAAETSTMQPFDDAGQANNTLYTYISAWYLSTITPAGGGEIISFEYHSSGPQLTNPNPKDNQSFSARFGTDGCQANVSSGSQFNSRPPQISIARKYLKKITLTRNAETAVVIDVQSATGLRSDAPSLEDRRLQSLKQFSVTNGVQKVVKQYDLTQNYFTNPNQPTYYKLRLDNVQERGQDGVTAVKPAYEFTYNAAIADLPARYTNSLDHWGFYNHSFNSSLVPTITFDGGTLGPLTIGGQANREPLLDGVSFGVLNKIKYPTGGYTSFEYELHRAENNRAVGGIRIRQMIDHSFLNKAAIVKKYSYTNNDGSSSGIAGLPEYLQLGSYQQFPINHFGTDCSKGGYTMGTASVSANSIFGLGSVQGSHIGYSQVTEIQTDLVTNETLGSTVNKYTVMLRENDDDISNGDLIEQSVFDKDGKILTATNNIYSYASVGSIRGYKSRPRDYQSNKDMYCLSASPQSYFNYSMDVGTGGSSCMANPPLGYTPRSFPTRYDLIEYSMGSQKKMLMSQLTRTYDQLTNSFISSNKDFTYGNTAHNYPTVIKETTNNGEQVVTNLKYAADYSMAAQGPPVVCPNQIRSSIFDLLAYNLKGTVIEKTQHRQNPDGSNQRFISGQITRYALNNPLDVYILESATPVTSFTPSSNSAGGCFVFNQNYRLAGSFKYDVNGNLSEQSKSNDMAKSYLWDYSSLYPVAEVQNALSAQVAYTSFETSYKGNFTFSGSPQNQPNSPGGNRVYNIANGPVSGIIEPSKTYILSYWKNNNGGGPFTVTGNISVSQSIPHNGWTCYTHEVLGGSSVTVSGTGLLDELRLYPKGALMTTATYEPLIGKTSDQGINNSISFFDYDVANRLINVRDADRNIVKNFSYNYNNNSTAPTPSVQTLFFNAATQGNFTKTCADGSTTTVVYKVPYGKWTATTQYTADQRAILDRDTNGPAYANNSGVCVFYNVFLRYKYFRNNCLYGIGGFIWYEVPANKYTGATQAAADAQAQQEAATFGQAQANKYGTCPCQAEGQMMINGACETGTRYYTSSVQSGNQWYCTYYYIFSNGATSQYYSGYYPSPCAIVNPN